MSVDVGSTAPDFTLTNHDRQPVTLSGTVHSPDERARALALARETNGVSKVVDQLTVR